MAKYNLLCTHDHKFEGWFDSETAYLDQKKKNLLLCPMCDDPNVRRALMAPSIVKTKTKESPKKDKKNKVFFNSRQALKNLNNWVTKNCEDVGRNFAKEARKASKGERDDHIFGTATDNEVKKLHDEGIGAIPIPEVKDN